jgi:hypothetical protein
VAWARTSGPAPTPHASPARAYDSVGKLPGAGVVHQVVCPGTPRVAIGAGLESAVLARLALTECHARNKPRGLDPRFVLIDHQEQQIQIAARTERARVEHGPRAPAFDLLRGVEEVPSASAETPVGSGDSDR